MLTSSAIANDSRVNRNVIANTRAGIPIQRGPSELFFAMLLNYTIRIHHRDSLVVAHSAETSTTKGTNVHEKKPSNGTFVAFCVLRGSGFSGAASSK
jgi:hypothetical protein